MGTGKSQIITPCLLLIYIYTGKFQNIIKANEENDSTIQDDSHMDETGYESMINMSIDGSGTAGAGGVGGGGIGNATATSANNGTTNTGGGGGGSYYASGYGNGGSGIVIIRYPSTFADAASVTNGTKTSITGFTVYTFLSSGSITF